MGNLVLSDPSLPPAKARSIQVRVEAPPESFSAFMGIPRSGGLLYGVPSQDRGRFHYHFLPRRAPGSSAWRLVLLKTWEPRNGAMKTHEVVWETPLVSEGDLKRWAAAIVHRVSGVELLAGELRSAGFGLSSLSGLESVGWMPFDLFMALFRRLGTEKRVVITNDDLTRMTATNTNVAAPDVLLLGGMDDEGEIRGMAFRCLRQPEGALADRMGMEGASNRTDDGPYYFYCRTTMIPWLFDLLVDSALEAIQDRGVRERLETIQPAIWASRKGEGLDLLATIMRELNVGAS